MEGLGRTVVLSRQRASGRGDLIWILPAYPEHRIDWRRCEEPFSMENLETRRGATRS